MWLLQGNEPDLGSLSFRLPAGTTRTLGRADGADFIIEAPLASRRHCRITAAADVLTVTDLASTKRNVRERRARRGTGAARERSPSRRTGRFHGLANRRVTTLLH
jgi:hypothetical protein